MKVYYFKNWDSFHVFNNNLTVDKLNNYLVNTSRKKCDQFHRH